MLRAWIQAVIRVERRVWRLIWFLLLSLGVCQDGTLDGSRAKRVLRLQTVQACDRAGVAPSRAKRRLRLRIRPRGSVLEG